MAGTFDDDPPYTQFSVISYPRPNALGDIARVGVHTGGHPTSGQLIVDYISLRPDPRLGHARPHASDILLGYWHRTAMRHTADLQSVKIMAVAETTFLDITPMVLETMGNDPRRRGDHGPLRIERWHTGPYAMIENSTFGKMARYML